jgi:hypothetical protein
MAVGGVGGRREISDPVSPCGISSKSDNATEWAEGEEWSTLLRNNCAAMEN